MAIANALDRVPADDPGIVAPANCQVPPGSTCPSDPASSSSPPSPTPMPTS